jgi:FkbM family methyltransferase
MFPLDAIESRAQLEAHCRAYARVVPVEGSMVACRVLGGPCLLLDMRDVQIAVHLAMDGFWESWITLAIARHVRPGWRCIDVGANCGYYTALLGSLVGPSGRVWAWEPNPDLVPSLCESVRLNGLGGVVEVIAAAATDRPGECHLHLPASDFRNTLNASIVAEASGTRIVPVTGRTLDDVCAGQSVEFIKIDAEGAEALIWDGMRDIRHQNRGLTILLEFNAARYPDPAAFVSRIVSDGFTLRHVDYDGSIRPVSGGDLLDQSHGDWMLWLSRKAV